MIKVKYPLFVTLVFCAFNAMAQMKDSMFLVCPFEHGSGREPKEAYTWNPPDKKVIMISKMDSIVRATVTGKVSNVNPTDEQDKFEIVIYTKNYYFWYYGVSKPLVSKGQDVKAGQTIGLYKFGTELEFRMFKDEELLDPRNMLECKVPKAE